MPKTTDYITKAANIKSDNISVEEPRKSATGAQFANIRSKNEILCIQMPKLEGFGADVYEDDKGKKFTMSMRFKKDQLENDKTIKNTFDGISNVVTSVKDHAKENGKAYFNKKNPSKDHIDAVFSESLKESKDKETQETDGRYFTMKVKLKVNKEGSFDFGVFDSNKNKMDVTPDNVVSKIKKWSTVKCTLKPVVWVISGKFGITWELVQMQYWEPEGGRPDMKNEFCMIESSDDEEEEQDEEKVDELIDDDESD